MNNSEGASDVESDHTPCPSVKTDSLDTVMMDVASDSDDEQISATSLKHQVVNNDEDNQQKDSIAEETGIEESDDEEAVYCVCRRPAGNGFMIFCKECEEWFHGDCVGITRMKGGQIMSYYCMQCHSKDPSLKIIYKPEKKRAVLQSINQLTPHCRHHDRADVDTNSPPTQCQGPGCINASRPHSKYCSDECGIQLAIRLIRAYLPEAKEAYRRGGEPEATKLNREQLKSLELEQQAIKAKLEELDKYTKTLDAHIAKVANVKPITEVTEEEVMTSDGDIEEDTIDCPTCGVQVSLKKAIVHMEKCFMEVERSVSFVGVVKSEWTDIICDKYDPVQNTYCKRLRVLCPQHTREAKVGPNDVCGCPVRWDPAVEEHPEFCRQSKRSCTKHYCWDKLYHADLDQEKLNQRLKLEKVNEQMCVIERQIECRGSLLAIMLNSTIVHDNN